VGYAAGIRKTRNAHIILIVKPERRNHHEDSGMEGKIVLNCMLTEMRWRYFEWV